MVVVIISLRSIACGFVRICYRPPRLERERETNNEMYCFVHVIFPVCYPTRQDAVERSSGSTCYVQSLRVAYSRTERNQDERDVEDL